MTRHFVCTAFFTIILALQCVAQPITQTKRDSMLLEINKGIPDTDKVHLLVELCRDFISKNADIGLNYAQHALSMSKQLGYQRGISNANRSIGICYMEKDENDSARFYLNEAISVAEAEGSKLRLAYGKMDLSDLESSEGKSKKAEKIALEALQICSNAGDPAVLAEAHMHFGNVLSKFDHWDEALIEDSIASRIFAEIKDDYQVAGILCNEALIFRKQNKNRKAFQNFEAAAEKLKTFGNCEYAGIVYEDWGDLYYSRNDFQETFHCYYKSLNIFKNIGNRRRAAVMHSKIGYLLFCQKNYSEAKKEIETSLAIAREVKNDATVKYDKDLLKRIEREL